MRVTLTFEIPDDAIPIQAQLDYKDKDGYMVTELFQNTILECSPLYGNTDRREV